MPLQDFISQQQHVDYITGARLQMWHNADFVVLRGPATFTVSQNHRNSPQEPFVLEPSYSIKIRSGEVKKIVNQEYTGTHPGDWNTEVILVSED